MQNSVLYNLAGQQVGYSPNFVTDANITTTTTSPLVIGASSVPLGLAGVISGPGGVSITNGGSASLSGTNTYTGPTSVSGGYLALSGRAASTDVRRRQCIRRRRVRHFRHKQRSIGPLDRGDQSGMVWLGSNAHFTARRMSSRAKRRRRSDGLTARRRRRGAGRNRTSIRVPTTINGGFLLVDGIITGPSNVSVNATGTLAGTGIVDPLTVTINSGRHARAGHAGRLRHAYDRRYAPFQWPEASTRSTSRRSSQQFEDRDGRIGDARRRWHRGDDTAAWPLRRRSLSILTTNGPKRGHALA